MLHEADIGLVGIQALENEILYSLVADRLFSRSVMPIDIRESETVMKALYLYRALTRNPSSVNSLRKLKMKLPPTNSIRKMLSDE